jgi:hypothetical protein
MVWQLKLNENCSKKYCIIQIPNTWSLTQYLNDKIKYTFWTWLFQVKICEKKCFLVKQKNVTVIDLSLDGLIEKLKNLLIQYLINLLPSSKKINRCSLLSYFKYELYILIFDCGNTQPTLHSCTDIFSTSSVL